MTADTDREALREDVLERERYEEALKHFAQNTAGTLDHIREGKYRRWLEAHDAALRAEIDRLREIRDAARDVAESFGPKCWEDETVGRAGVYSGDAEDAETVERLEAKLEGEDD